MAAKRMQTRRDFGKTALIGLATAATASAIDWTQWRGPKGDGISPEKGLLQDWPKEGPRLVWAAKGFGLGHATVVTSGKTIVSAGDKDGQSRVVAVSATDGKQLWTAPLGKAGAPGWGGFEGTRSTPTIDPETRMVFAVGQYGEIVALKLDDGKEIWRKSLVSDFSGPLPEWGYSQSPILDGSKVIFTPGGAAGAVIALEASSGKEVWRSADFKDAAHYAPVVIATIDGVKQYIQLTEKSLASLDPASGKVLWRTDRPGKVAVIPTPVVFGNLVYTTSGYGVGCSCFEIKKDGDKWNVKELYANKTLDNHHGGVIRLGPNVFGHADSKGWTCQDIATGKALWQDKSFRKGSICYADNRFIIRGEEGAGSVALIEASVDGYKEHGRFDPPHRSEVKNTWAHPVVSEGKLYIRDQDTLLCFDISAKS